MSNNSTATTTSNNVEPQPLTAPSQSTTTSTQVRFFPTNVHPGHVFLSASLPLLALAYRDYRTPLENVVQTALSQRQQQLQLRGAAAASSASPSPVVNHLAAISSTASTAAAAAEEDAIAAATRRAMASAVAFRALHVATLASCGTFGLVTACAFYASNCSSVEEAIIGTRQWAERMRRRLDAALGILPNSSVARVDAGHPEVRAIQGMNEQEELEHIRKTYFSDDDSDWYATTTTPSTEDEGNIHKLSTASR